MDSKEENQALKRAAYWLEVGIPVMMSGDLTIREVYGRVSKHLYEKEGISTSFADPRVYTVIGMAFGGLGKQKPVRVVNNEQ